MYEGVSKSFRKVDNEINNNKHSLRRNIKDYGGKTHYTVSQSSRATAPSGRELLQFAVLTPGGQSGNFWIHLRTVLNGDNKIINMTTCNALEI
jgi:hypothetical protein